MANNFSGDSNCVALYRFENGALTTDSKDSNALTGNSPAPTVDTSDFQEGAACVDLEAGVVRDWFWRNDADLSSDFPFKNGTSNQTISAAFWAKFESFPGGSGLAVISKSGWYDASFNFRQVGASSMSLGVYAGGWEYYTFATALTTARWYHIAFTYQNSDKTYRIRIWDDTAGALLGADKAGTGTKNVPVTANNLSVGAGISDGTQAFDGKLDEVVIFNDVLTVEEIDAIRGGTYGASAVKPWYYYANAG